MSALRVLVTGATTPIGRAVIDRLLAADDVSAVLACGRESAAACGLPLEAPGLSYESCDLRRPRVVHDLLFGSARRLELTAVVHASHHRDARHEGRAVHQQNVASTRELLRLLDRHPTIRRFVLRSHAEVYRVDSECPDILDEDQPLELGPTAPQWIRDRVEADLTACARTGLSRAAIVVLRCAECLAPGCGSQLHDFLSSAVCLRPLGFDPMINVISIPDIAAAVLAALRGEAQGVFNIPGADTLSLSRAVSLAGRADIPVPGPALAPLYGLRSRLLGTGFRYDVTSARLHFNGVLDGRRAREELGYTPTYPVDWAALREQLSVERRALGRVAALLGR